MLPGEHSAEPAPSQRQCVGRKRAALEVPEKGLAKLCLGLREYLYPEPPHSAVSRARTSDQGTPAVAPERSASRRRRSSCFHASETLWSSLPSRLSISAAATAERSSTGRPSTSSSTWSTRAFMAFQSSTRLPAPPPRPSRECTASGTAFWPRQGARCHHHHPRRGPGAPSAAAPHIPPTARNRGRSCS